MVTACERRPRQLITKNGVLNLADAIEVVSLRKPLGQDAFVTKRAESTPFLAPRNEHLRVLDHLVIGGSTYISLRDRGIAFSA